MSAREPAWRLLARELGAAVEEEKGLGDRAASYLVSPLGARINRALLVGSLTPPTSLGKEESQPFFRSALTDPTGSVNVTAGSFQPRALAQLRAVSVPTRALVVGKVTLYRGRDGTAYVSVRAEALRAVADADYRTAMAEAVADGLARLELTERLRSGRPATPPGAIVPASWLRGAQAAVSKYPTVDLGPFRDALRRALAEAMGRGPVAEETDGTVTVTRIDAARPRPPPSAAERAQESAFLDIIDRLAEESVDGYADLKEAFALAAGVGVSAGQSEELLNRLEESGAIEEPVVGKLRRA